MTKRFAELLLLGGFLVLAVLLYNSTAAYPKFVQGSTAAYVRFLAICLGILCLFELFFSSKNKKENGQKAPLNMADAPRRFWGLCILLFIYAASFEFLGFYLASAIFLPTTMFLLGARKPVSITLTTVSILLFVYLVFEKLLGVFLPTSSLFG
ncbi:tripartite tricarboxylate transporter TctB family protein [Halodesulfovibrio marinisediminis]|uniref:Putative tricarboxylic transport membrane protein n=1 Tax=Halodesulfovibrio marinisediminis DSM 17456 TaxID=1121457 RepID=A0A1N6I7S5_9BACT|nr:tripartite tricarboxylate transporter TctB family protein [Halodesulfovibrio marinisediminis]SIO28088.1 putative tricarboxylic transport membrane protein [Halodesulfovibrio marinisediminis DSM 17456]